VLERDPDQRGSELDPRIDYVPTHLGFLHVTCQPLSLASLGILSPCSHLLLIPWGGTKMEKEGQREALPQAVLFKISHLKTTENIDAWLQPLETWI
jgi:hypothetical protein